LKDDSSRSIKEIFKQCHRVLCKFICHPSAFLWMSVISEAKLLSYLFLNKVIVYMEHVGLCLFEASQPMYIYSVGKALLAVEASVESNEPLNLTATRHVVTSQVGDVRSVGCLVANNSVYYGDVAADGGAIYRIAPTQGHGPDAFSELTVQQPHVEGKVYCCSYRVTRSYSYSVGRCGVVGSTLAFGSIGHGFESEHHLFSHHGVSVSAFSKLRSLAKCSLDDSVL